MIKNILYWLLLILVLRQTDGIAQKLSVGNFSLSHYTDDNGLPQNSVNGIAADGQGFIWLATEGGLVRFDGQRFYTFTKSNTSIPNNWVYMLQPSLEDAGQTFARLRNSRHYHSSGSVVPKTFYAVADGNKFIRIQNGTAALDSLYSAKISRLPFMIDGVRRTYISSRLPHYLGIGTRHCIVPATGGNGHFYVCDTNSVTYHDYGKKSYQIPFKNAGSWDFFTIGKALYFFHPNGELSHITKSGSTRLTLTGAIANQKSLGPKHLKIYWNNVSDQTFLYQNKNLYSVEQQQPGKLTTRLLLEEFDFQQNNITTIYHDLANQRFFLGSPTRGLFVLIPKPFETLTINEDERENIFYAQMPFGDDRVLTPTGLVLGKDRQSGKRIFGRLPAIESVNGIGKFSDKYSLLTDQKGAIWIKSWNNLLQFDPKGQREQRRWDLGNEIKQIYQGPEGGVIWIGTKSKGLYRINPVDSIPMPESVIKEPLSQISCFRYETPGVLFIGTEHGLYKLNVHSRAVQLIGGTQHLFIRSIYIPRPGEIWFTTYGNGFYLLKKNKLTRFPLDANQHLATSHYIFEDKRGYFWIPTNKGLFQMARTDLLNYAKDSLSGQPFYQYYTKDQGFLINEFNGGCQLGPVRLKNGYVSMPSLLGLVWFIPEQLTIPLPSKPILLDRVQVNNVSLRVMGDTIRLPPEPKQVQIHLTTPYFGNLNNLYFTYSLTETYTKPKPAEWITINSQQPTILFSTLPSGTHTLLVRKTNGFGTGNYSYKKITLIVPPLWYETGWARAIMSLLGLVGIYIFVRLHFQNILQKNQKLEMLIAKRTEDLHLTMSQLAQSEQELNRQLHLQTRLLASISHDVQSPLQFITNTTRRMNKLITERKYNLLSEVTETIYSTTGNITILLKDLLVYTKTKVYERRNEPEIIDLHALVVTKCMVFKSMLLLNQNKFVNDVPVDFQVNSDLQLLGIIIHNLIDNAVKYTEKGLIQVYVWQDNQVQHLIIANTGPGMSPQTVDWFNQVDGKIDSSILSITDNKSGVGLLIAKELAALINIRLFVEQAENTAIHLVFSQEQAAIGIKPAFTNT